MSRRPRRNHSAAFKAKVAITAIRGDRTIAQIAKQFDVQAKRLKQLERENERLKKAAS
jgi:transposase-like protein